MWVKVAIKEFDVVSCTQIQTVILIPQTKLDVDADGNGSITLAALNTDDAITKARSYLIHS